MEKFTKGINQVVMLKSKQQLEEEFGICEYEHGYWSCRNVPLTLPSQMHDDLYGIELVVDYHYKNSETLGVLGDKGYWNVSPKMCVEVGVDDDDFSIGDIPALI